MSNDRLDKKPELPSHIAYSIEKGSNDKSHWHRIGAAWPNKDGGLSVKLNAVPVDGRINLQLRDEIQRMQAAREFANEQFQKENELEPKP